MKTHRKPNFPLSLLLPVRFGPTSLALVLSGLIAATALGQSALDGFDPNANGTIRTIVVQPDGKILLGGDFTTLAPNGSSVVTRNYIARLNPDGTLDSAFDPNANSPVQTIVLQGDGKILVGGAFTTIGRQHRTRLARLNSDSGLADSFDAHADPSVTPAILAIAVQPDGKILVGGVFSGPNCIGGQTRNYLARLDSTTGLADSFDPNPNGYVTSIVLQPDRKILVAGEFKGTNSIGGQARNYLARIDATTGLADSFNPNPNGEVYAIAIQPDGKVVTGGAFHTIGGQARSCIARLDSTTGFADFFNPSANDAIISVAIQADGKILAVGAFHGANSIGGKTRNGIARIDPVTGAIDSFDPNAGVVAPTLAVAVQTNGKILVGGNFTALAPNGGTTVARNRIARLETNGRLDQTLNPSVLGEFVAALAVQPDGKIIIGGKFTTVLGVARNSIARLNADGTLDLAFNPNANDWVLSIALQPDGKVLASGRFSSIGGQLRNRIARLDAVTGAADSFDPNANDVVYSVAMQPDGKVLAGGLFTTIGGLSRNRIARLDPATGSADAFDPNANQIVFSIVVQADGKILVGGVFNHIGGQARNLIARLDPTTSAADSFDPNANNYVQTIALQPDGKILVGGQFTNIGGQMRNHIARLDPWTGVADSFNPNATYSVYSIAVQADGKILTGGEFESIGGQPRHNIARLDASGLADSFDPSASQIVNAVAVQPDGKVVAGGYFQSIGGQSRNLLARLSNDTAAVQELTAAERSIVWRRGGSSPQFTRVEFEFSTDNINYSFLGDGVSVGANWVLRGPWRLPIGENFFVRARGHYVTGFFNGSESMAESVRSVFLITDETGPPPVPFPTATATASPMPTPTATATPTATPTAAATVTPAAEATATATATPSPTATATATPTATLTATVAPTRMVTPFPSRTPAPGSILGNVFSRLLVGTGDDVRTTLPQSDRRFRPPFGGQ